VGGELHRRQVGPRGSAACRLHVSSASSSRRSRSSSCSAGGRLRRPAAADVLAICGLGALGFGVYQILWTTGLTTVPAGDSALIIASTPVLVAILAVIAGSDVLTQAKLVGGLISFLGVAVVIGSGPG